MLSVSPRRYIINSSNTALVKILLVVSSGKVSVKSYSCLSPKVARVPVKLIEEISSSEILQMINNGTITEGMIPKIDTCLDAVNNGVTAVGIIDGRKKHSILFELFSDKGSGTLIRK